MAGEVDLSPIGASLIDSAASAAPGGQDAHGAPPAMPAMLPVTDRPGLGRRGGVRIMSSFEAIVRRYEERTRKSRELHDQAKTLLPRGVSSNFRVVDPNPIFIESAIGTTITDADGKKYTDFSMAIGEMLVGHAHHRVVQE